MAFISSLVHVLRETAERALAHARPPGPIKHGGAAPWRQHVRPLSLSSTKTRSFAQPGTVSSQHEYESLQHNLDLASANTLKDPVNTLFRAIRKHAMEPLFVGLKSEVIISNLPTGPVGKGFIARQTKTSWSRKAESQTFRGPSRAKADSDRFPCFSSSVQDVGLQLARQNNWRTLVPGQSATHFYTMINWAPSLGLRAAVDELENELKSWGRDEAYEGNKKATVKGVKRSNSTMKSNEKVSLFERAPQSEIDSFWNDDDTDSSSCSLDDNYCDTCSSAYVDGVVSSPESDYFGHDDHHDRNVEAEFATPQLTTTMNVPMNPDVFRLLVGNDARPDRDPDELDYLHQIQDIVENYDAFRLNVLVPLERGLQDGFLALLHPQGWNAGQLYWDPSGDGYAYLPITFVNRSRTEVLNMLWYDVEVGLYRILEDLVTDNSNDVEDTLQEAGFATEDEVEGASTSSDHLNGHDLNDTERDNLQAIGISEIEADQSSVLEGDRVNLTMSEDDYSDTTTKEWSGSAHALISTSNQAGQSSIDQQGSLSEISANYGEAIESSNIDDMIFPRSNDSRYISL